MKVRLTLTSLLFLFSVSSVLAADTPASVAEVQSVDPFTKSVMTEFDKHNYKKLIKVYEDYKEKNPQKYIPFKTRSAYCQALAEVGDVEGAIRNLKELLEDWPVRLDIIKSQYDLANLLFMQGLKEEAKEAYEKILLQAEQSNQIVQKSRERLSQLRQLDTKKKDQTALKILEIETSLEVGETSRESVDFLNKVIVEEPNSRNAARARLVLKKTNDFRSQKGKALLDEARRLFDEEKKYQEAQDILDLIDSNYPDVVEPPSVEALKKAIREKTPKQT